LTKDKSYSVKLRKKAKLGGMYVQYNNLLAVALILALREGDLWALTYLKQKRIKDVTKEIKLLTNKINRLNAEIKRLDEVDKDTPEKSIEEMVAEMQLAFGYQIDVDKITAKQWIMLQQKAKERNNNARTN